MTELVGQEIGRYRIIEKLGEGGMAEVYKAIDTPLDRVVAIKFIRRNAVAPNLYEGMLKRFEREAKSLARLEHANIVTVFDYGEFNGEPYLVMPFLPGGTLKQMVGRPHSSEQAARLLLPVADALAYAHSLNLIHRDVKPANILLSQSGKPLLSDFGIAKVLTAEETTLTATGVGIGTPHYMAPEQGLGKNVDHRADIYALGVVLYELVTGRKPYDGDTPMEIVYKHMSDPLPRPRDYIPDLPEATEKIIFKAMAKQPENRYQTMSGFAEALETLLTSRPAPAPAPAVDRASVETIDELVLPTRASPPVQTIPAGQVVEATSYSNEIPAGQIRISGPLPGDAPSKKGRSCLSLAGIIAVVLVIIGGVGITAAFMLGALSGTANRASSPAASANATRFHTPTTTLTLTRTLTPAVSLVRSSTPAPARTATPTPTRTRTNPPAQASIVTLTIENYLKGTQYLFMDGRYLMSVEPLKINRSNIRAGTYEFKWCADPNGKNCASSWRKTISGNTTIRVDRIEGQ